jgi:hypothetical protein
VGDGCRVVIVIRTPYAGRATTAVTSAVLYGVVATRGEGQGWPVCSFSKWIGCWDGVSAVSDHCRPPVISWILAVSKVVSLADAHKLARS